MRKTIIMVCAALAAVSCSTKNNDTMKANEIFPKGQKAETNFTGTAWVEMLVTDDATFDTQVYNVTFESGCRNYWHSHPGGQLLLVTSGEGYYQEKGSPIRLLRPGDVVEIKPDIVHWHGATPDSEFVHIGITTQADKGAATWYGPVSDEEYNSYAMNGTEKQAHYTFELSDKVTRQKVTFTNRYGITLTGDLYTPKNHGSERLPAIAVSGPFGAVKEQSSGLYANQMAARGFVTLAFDPSYTGESGGEPRYVASPDINTEDFSAAVDFLSTYDGADPERIGLIGICGWGGLAINSAAMDTRVKATVASTMYDMSRVSANGYYDAMDEDARYELRRKLNAQLRIDERFYATLFDFAEPWKIDILDFLNENYMYDLSMEEIASFTGRSLSTFKRDFKKISDLSPEKWLIRRRLEAAQEMLREKGKSVTDVYVEVGFKNLSHFSTAFKKQYGVAPSSFS